MSLSVEQQDSGAAGRVVITKQVSRYSRMHVYTNIQVETCTIHKDANVGCVQCVWGEGGRKIFASICNTNLEVFAGVNRTD